LFDTPQAASEYERAYQAAVALGHVEQLAAPSAGFRILQIQVGEGGAVVG
jgi:spermidine synthase